MGWVEKALDTAADAMFLPRNPTPTQQRAHLARLTLVSCGTFALLVLSWVVLVKVARPEVVTKVDLAAAILPVQTRVDAQEASFKSWMSTSNDRWGYQIRSAVIQMEEERCKLPVGSQFRNQLNQQIDAGVQRYQRTTGDTTFQATPCSGF